jgi:hypothetical protein
MDKPIDPTTHAALDYGLAATMLAVPWLTGACKGTKAKLFFLGCAGLALGNFLMTDFDATDESKATYAMEDVSAVAEEALEPLLRT